MDIDNKERGRIAILPLVATAVQVVVVKRLFLYRTTPLWTAPGGFLVSKKKFVEYKRTCCTNESSENILQ